MKKQILLTAIILISLPASSQAAPESICAAAYDIAEFAMSRVQSELPKEPILSLVGRDNFMRMVVEQAYSQPVASDDDTKLAVVNAFSQNVYRGCLGK